MGARGARGHGRQELTSGRARRRARWAPALRALVLLLAPAWGAAATLYGVDNIAGRLFTLDPRTGQAEPVARLPFENVRDLAWDARRERLLGVDTETDQVIAVDPGSGAVRVLSRLATRADPFIGSVAVDPASGALLGVDYASARLVRIDPDSGRLVGVLRLSGGAARTGAIAFDREGRLWLTDTASHRLRRVDLASGRLETVARYDTVDYVTAIAFDPADGALWGVDTRARALVRIDPESGRTEPRPGHRISFITGIAVVP